ncbi:MAG: hypothetical protein M3Q75_10305 [Gemmatimonadota bacterium]|nr:hypothetical protein [Gemmatimonadota bacterium]
MILKRPPLPRRLRSLPSRGFGWIDHRFLRDGYLSRASPEALALYCLLVCASDQQGLSYYSQERLCALLLSEEAALLRSRRELIELGLLAYQKPIYQLLSLESAPAGAPAPPRHSSLQKSAPTRSAAPPPPSPPPSLPPPAPAAAALPGLNLRAMVEARLRAEGGAA